MPEHPINCRGIKKFRVVLYAHRYFFTAVGNAEELYRILKSTIELDILTSTARHFDDWSAAASELKLTWNNG